MFRKSSKHIPRYVATCRTAKHRIFTFLNTDTIPDAKILAISLEESSYLAMLSSSAHCVWAFNTGAFLEDRPNYNHADCFNKFPFPDLQDGELKTQLTELGEKLDSFRKARQAEHPTLTLTGMYNVLEKLRRNEPLTDKDKTIHDQGLVTILQQIHDDIDRHT